MAHLSIIGGHCGHGLALRSVLKIPINCMLFGGLLSVDFTGASSLIKAYVQPVFQSLGSFTIVTT